MENYFRGIDLYTSALPAPAEQENVYCLKNDSGTGVITTYQVFSGIELIYNDMHMFHSQQGGNPTANIIEINHCREGRYECEFDDHSFCYMEKGDLAVSSPTTIKTTSHFPTGHYHGVSVLLHRGGWDEALRGFFTELCIDIPYIYDLVSRQPVLVKRATPSIEHIFSELYSSGDARRMGYYKIKILELLLFLSDLQDDAEQRPVFPAHHVRAVKAIRDYITEDVSRKFTLEELSRRFDIPLTAMKKAFRGVYGASIYDYFRSWRLELGAELLRDSDSSITAIAQRVGYENPSKFTSAFHQKTGMSPFQYRKSVRLDKK